MPSGTEPLYCRVAAGALPGLPGPLTRSHPVGPVSEAPPGDTIRHGAAFMPGGGWRLTRPTGASHRLTPRRPGKRSATGRCHQAQSRFIAGALTGSHPVGPVSAAPPGDTIRHGAAFMPGGGWRLTRPTVRSSPPLTYPLVRLKLPVLRPQHR
ncbi:hypothetical protein BOR82_20885 [Klebsiella pneumoniae]|nr:hypothetical protein [Klebsiella pneumoniae]